MSLLLTVTNGPLVGKKIWVNSGQTLQVGRTELADLQIEPDKLMSRLHFAIDCEPDSSRIRDLGSRNGTFVNGSLVKVAPLSNGDRVLAGETEFSISVKSPGAGPATGTARKSWTKDRLDKKTATGAAAPPQNTSPIVLDEAQRLAVQTFVMGPPGSAVTNIDELTMTVPMKFFEASRGRRQNQHNRHPSHTARAACDLLHRRPVRLGRWTWLAFCRRGRTFIC